MEKVEKAEKGQNVKFQMMTRTACGKARAFVELRDLEILWFNTGTLCNIGCVHCYIESNPKNDRLVYINLEDVIPFLDEIEEEGYHTKRIGFTGGEPFMNPHMNDILDETLKRGFEVVLLTNAMQPMMRPYICARLKSLNDIYREKLIIRVSLDHYQEKIHDLERGLGAWEKTLIGLKWLSQNGFRIHIAGRHLTQESDEDLYSAYKNLCDKEQIKLDERDESLVIFPEMDEGADVPEITTQCWDILNVNPRNMMCATSRMVVKRKGEKKASIAPCTLLPYQLDFDLGASLKQAKRKIWLNHPHCARFCVLGGGSCSGS